MKIRTLIATVSAAVFGMIPALPLLSAPGAPIHLRVIAARNAAPPGGATLNDSGLVVRYYFDEAASGTAPTAVNDYGPNNIDLSTINYGSGNMAYTEVGGNRGLDSTATSGTQRASYPVITSDAIHAAINGSQTATLEIVADVDAVTASSSRVFGLTNRTGGSGALMLRVASSTTWTVAVRHGGSNATDTFTLALGARTVFHVVVDTTAASNDDRIIVYADGVVVTTTVAGAIAQNGTINLGTNVNDIIAMNRESSGAFERSYDGIMYYGAIYDEAFSSTRVTDHYDILTADDDAP